MQKSRGEKMGVLRRECVSIYNVSGIFKPTRAGMTRCLGRLAIIRQIDI